MNRQYSYNNFYYKYMHQSQLCDAPCADSDIEGEETYDDMLTTDQMIQMLGEDDSDKEFLGFD